MVESRRNSENGRDDVSRRIDPSLAIHGGAPVRDTPLPYARQSITDEDIAAVTAALKSDWLTTGPLVAEYETAVAQRVGAKEAVAVSSGTAALHTAFAALGIGAGDEVILPTLTFAATASTVIFQGARPVFADVDPATLLVDPASVEARITPATRAIVSVDYAGQPCDYGQLSELAERKGLAIVDDACHALGASYRGEPIGSITDATAFSTHSVKHIATGEGGVVTTDRSDLASRMRRFRNHGITLDHRERANRGSWHYEIRELGYNYRLTDIQCALGLSQLQKLDLFIERRRAIAARYNKAFKGNETLSPLELAPLSDHVYHLYVVRLNRKRLESDRSDLFAALRAEGIGVNVHYIPVHLQPYYQKEFGTGPGDCPEAERAYQEILTLPMFPAMRDSDVDDVVNALSKVIGAHTA